MARYACRRHPAGSGARAARRIDIPVSKRAALGSPRHRPPPAWPNFGDRTRSMLRVAVLIPALDEEAGLAQVLRELPRSGRVAAVPSAAFEVRDVVVVDNGSRDRTPEVARAGGATVVLEPRRGYGAACLAGLAHLRRDPPDVVVFLDADASDDPREIEGLLAPILGGADLVVGSRVLGRLEPGAMT